MHSEADAKVEAFAGGFKCWFAICTAYFSICVTLRAIYVVSRKSEKIFDELKGGVAGQLS